MNPTQMYKDCGCDCERVREFFDTSKIPRALQVENSLFCRRQALADAQEMMEEQKSVDASLHLGRAQVMIDQRHSCHAECVVQSS